MYALREHGSSVGVKGGDTLIQRFVALKDLDETTSDAVTWSREPPHSIKGEFGLMIVPVGTEIGGNLFITDDPHRAFFTLMREVYPNANEQPAGHVEWEGVTIGRNCSIGGPGFGYVPQMGIPLKEGESRFRVPHIGRVVIGDDVDIGDNTVINRGCLGDTVIGRGTKIDGHVFIAHNAQIGEDCMIIAGAVICGSAVIENGAWIAAGACIRNGVTVGAGATVGLMANVVKDVPAGATVMGNPAK